MCACRFYISLVVLVVGGSLGTYCMFKGSDQLQSIVRGVSMNSSSSRSIVDRIVVARES